MINHERFRELLLDYLYDLADAPDVAEMEAYVAAHPEARLELDRARELLATAARVEFPAVRFEPPVPAGRAVPAQAPRRRSARTLVRWTVAICALLAVGALAYPTSKHVSGYWHAKNQVAAADSELTRATVERSKLTQEHDAKVAAAGVKVEDAAKHIRELQQKYDETMAAAMKQIRDNRLVLEVTGPPAIQPGAPNSFHITTKRVTDGSTVSSQITFKLMDSQNHVVYQEKDHSEGMYQVNLPPNLSFKSNADLSLEVSATSEGRIPSELKNVRLSWAAPRYATELTTDKPMYKPGETVYFRSLTLNRGTLQPPAEDFHVQYSITNPQGAQIFSMTGATRPRMQGPAGQAPKPILGPDGKPVRGIGAGEYKVPDAPEFPGGEYTLTVRELNNRFPEEKRKFLVNKYTPDRINKELDFHKKTYGAGEEVVANCKIWNESGPLANRPVVAAEANVDGKIIPARADGVTNALGQVSVRFALPKQIDKGAASMTVTFTDGGAAESIQKPIPIVVNKMFVKFFAEGGDLVAGLPNRVYFRATTPLDKPAELKGSVVDSRGVEVVKVETLNDATERGVNHGLGLFEFTPTAGEKYVLKIDRPAGIADAIPLPEVKNQGVVLRVPTGVTSAGQAIRAELNATGPARNLYVGAYCRGRMLDHQRVQTQPGKPAIVELKPIDDIGGVVRVTVFEQRNAAPRQVYVPVAERLVFRKSAKTVKFAITPDKNRYTPGDKASITIAATDEKGQPARAIVGASVVNQTVITMADEKTARMLPTHFMFIGEVHKPEDLEYADFLLTDHAKAPLALDLLLGTQGWRRFAEQDPNQFRRRNHEEAERILVMTGQSGERMVNTIAHRQQEIEAEYQPKMKELEERLKDAVNEKWLAAQDTEYPEQLRERSEEVRQREHDYKAAALALTPYDHVNSQIRAAIVPTLAGAALLLAIVALLLGAARGAKAGVPYYVTAAGSISVGVLLLIGFALSSKNDQAASTMLAGNASPARQGQVLAERHAPAAAAPDVPKEAGVEFKGRAKFDAAKGGDRRGLAVGKGIALGMEKARAPLAPAKPQDQLAGAAIPRAVPPANQPVDPKIAPTQRDAKAPDFYLKNKSELERLRDANQNRFRFARPGLAAKKAQGIRDEAKQTVQQQMAQAEFQKKLAEARLGANGRFRDARVANKDRMNRNGAIPAPGGPFARGGMGGGFGGGGAGLPGGGGAGGLGGFEGGFGGRGFGPGGGFGYAGAMPTPEPFIVREYAHINNQGNCGERTDFAETVYWNPALVLDESGKKTISFNVSDSITKYRVLVAGHTLEGRLGADMHILEVRKPFGLEAKLPAEVTAGDKLSIPVLITNDSDEQRAARVTVEPKGFNVVSGGAAHSIVLPPNKRTRRVVQLQPSLIEGDGALTILGKGEPFAEDQVTRSIKIVPDGFPFVGQASDLLEKVAENEMVLPKDYVKGSLNVWASIYPSTLASLQKGLEGLLREPYGCFEQTSTTNYPNTLILNYIKESGQDTQEAKNAVQRANQLLDRGYQRLTSFECQKQSGGREGYEWFGGMAPPHEALTAYGLLQFKDMAKVHPVDQQMLERTRKYLLSRHKPDGGFMRNPRALDSFGAAPQHITDAYIVWALTETGQEDMTKDIDKLLREHAKSTDSYFLSLLANALLNSDGVDRAKQAVDLLKRVRDKQAADGGVTGAETSITHSGGRDLQIETTALAMLGWMKANRPADFTECLQKAVKWINQQRGGYGGFGSTQSTIMALKALIAYTKASKQTAESGALVLTINGKAVEQLPFQAGRQEPVTILVKNPEQFVKAGRNSLKLGLIGKNKYPYTIGWSYSAITPNSSDQCAVKLSTKLNKQQVREGDGVRLNVSLENLSKVKGQPMTVAIIGLPAGLKVPEDMKQLKEMATLRKAVNGDLLPGDISFFEIRGRELVLYWRALKPGAKIDLAIDLQANIPGEYRGPASRAYLYYTSDAKQWVEPLSIQIEPAAGE